MRVSHSLLILLLFGWMLPGVLLAGQQGDFLAVGETAPVFSGVDLNGAAVDLADLRKTRKAVLINFWGLRCGDCLREMPRLNELHAKYQGKGLFVLGINVDGVPSDVIGKQLPKLAAIPVYPLISDQELKISDSYKLSAAPFTLLVDSNGKIVYLHEGYKDGDEVELEKRILQMVR